MRNRDYNLIYNSKTGGYEAVDNGLIGDANSVYNRIFTAINIKKGTLVSNHEYGSNLYKITKASKQNEMLIKTYIKDCLRPLAKNGLEAIKNLQISDVNIDTAAGKAAFSIRCENGTQNFNFDYWIKI